MTRGADHVMQTLAMGGVTDVFALSGNQIMPLFDASLDAGIRLYHTRHEAAAVYMAEGYAQISGGIGVALVTAGAGLGNAVGPLLTARASDTPLVLLSGDSPVVRDGQGAFQEMDQVGLTQSLTKWSVRPTQSGAVAATIAEAMHVARCGRPGPVHVALPADVLTTSARSDADFAGETPTVVQTQEPVSWIGAAQTPLVILGPELNETRAPGLAERLQTALNAPVIAMESPRGANDPTLGHLQRVFDRADRILLLGKPLDFTLKFGAVAPAAHWASVNADPAECARAQRATDGQALVLQQSARATAEALAQLKSHPLRQDWINDVATFTSQRPVIEADAKLLPKDVCSAVQTAVDEAKSPILVCDGGEFGQWAQALVKAPRRIINGVSGAIGGGLCYAMAARAADPTATVFALMGDGTVGFHLAEFETAVREGLPFIAIVGNDRSWNAEHQIQVRDYGLDRAHGCSLSEARYEEAVRSLGGFGAFVDEPADLPDAIRAAMASGKPACINVQMTGLPAPSFS